MKTKSFLNGAAIAGFQKRGSVDFSVADGGVWQRCWQ